MVPLLAMYVFLLYFTLFIGEHGKRVLFEHHAFLPIGGWSGQHEAGGLMPSRRGRG